MVSFCSWLSFTGLLAAAQAAPQGSSNNNDSYGNNNMTLWQTEDLSGANVPALSSAASSSASLAGSLAPPQADATNHTFKSLAFLGNTMDAFLPSASFSSSSSSSSMSMLDGFAVAPPATETELAHALPIFDFGMPRNITGRTGHTEAIIKCRVDSLHDKSVIIPSPFPCRLHLRRVWQINHEFTLHTHPHRCPGYVSGICTYSLWARPRTPPTSDSRQVSLPRLPFALIQLRHGNEITRQRIATPYFLLTGFSTT